MRTQEEIVERILKSQKEDIFGFATEVLVFELDFENAKQFLNKDTTKETWDEDRSKQADTLTEAKNYMVFAWGKAQDHRGLSAGRSLTKMTEYCWLLGKDDVILATQSVGRSMYGCAQLKVFSEALEVPVPTDAATQNMIKGIECQPGCQEGCNY